MCILLLNTVQNGPSLPSSTCFIYNYCLGSVLDDDNPLFLNNGLWPGHFASNPCSEEAH